METNVIKQSHPARVNWDILIMILSVFTSFTVPYEIAFMDGTSSGIEPYDFVNYFIDLFFGLDLIFNFFTTQIDPVTGQEVDEKS